MTEGPSFFCDYKDEPFLDELELDPDRPGAGIPVTRAMGQMGIDSSPMFNAAKVEERRRQGGSRSLTDVECSVIYQAMASADPHRAKNPSRAEATAAVAAALWAAEQAAYLPPLELALEGRGCAPGTSDEVARRARAALARAGEAVSALESAGYLRLREA